MKSCRKFIIIICGIPASGKTTFGRHISEKLEIPFMCKDHIKERLYDTFRYDTSSREVTTRYGAASYNLLWYFAETLMKSGMPFIMESNFTPQTEEFLLQLIDKYCYRTLTVLFDAEMEVLHKRFMERDVTEERHPGLAASGYFADYEFFKNATLCIRNFNVGGDRLYVDTTDFNAVCYDDIDMQVLDFVSS